MAASYQSSIQDQISDVTECSICAEVFANPKILPCVHTFCLRCLETYGKEKSPGDQMVCPICRREFLIPNGGFSDLPSNFFIRKMVEIAKQAMSPEIKSLCALCPEEDEVLAQLLCVDCEQNLCSRCGNGHKKSRFSRHHQVVELGCQPREKEPNFRNSYCDNHPDELIKMYCCEDKVAICLICCVESHQSHRCVNANKAAGEFAEQLKCSSGKVTSRIAECEELEEKLDKFKNEFQANVLKTEEGIREAAIKMIKLIQQHTEQLVQRLKSVVEKNIKAFETTKQDVDRFRVMIDSYSRYTEKLLTQGSPVDICRAVDQMLTRAQELETLPANCSGDRFSCDTLAFYPLDIQSHLTQGMINAIGELIITPSSDWLLQFGEQGRPVDHKPSAETDIVSSSADGIPPSSSSSSSSVDANMDHITKDGRGIAVTIVTETVEPQKAFEEERQLNDKHVGASLQKPDYDKQLLKSNCEAVRQIKFNEALNQAVSEQGQHIEEFQRTINYLPEIGADKSVALSQSAETSVQDSSVFRFVQSKLEDELVEAKQEILRLQSQLRLQSSSFLAQWLMGRSFMTQSVMGQYMYIPLPPDVSERRMCIRHPDSVHLQQDCEKLMEKLTHLSITGRSLDIVMQYVNIYKCYDGCVTLFIFNADLDHYLAYLTTDGPAHFLKSDCVGIIDNLDSDMKEVGKWMIAEVASRDFCLAKKVYNRFRVPIGTKFYRVKIKPWTPGQSHPEALAAEAEERDPDENPSEDRS